MLRSSGTVTRSIHIGIVALCSALCSSGCSRGIQDDHGALPWRVVATGFHSAIVDLRQIDVEDGESWHGIWTEHQGIYDSPGPLPTVNWERERVSALFLGSRPTSGTRLEVRGIRRTGGQMHVDARVRGPEGVRLSVLTQPHCMVALPRGTEPVVWIVEGLHSQGRKAARMPRPEDPPGSTLP